MPPDGSMGMCPAVHCLLGRVSLLLNMLDCLNLRNDSKKTSLFCLPRNTNNFGALWEVCLGFFSGFKHIVETGL